MATGKYRTGGIVFLSMCTKSDATNAYLVHVVIVWVLGNTGFFILRNP
jgi:hypothetical protein